jgi:hypothetical protein
MDERRIASFGQAHSNHEPIDPGRIYRFDISLEPNGASF